MVGADNSGALRRAAVSAAMAPSICSTQPWQLVLEPDVLSVYADRRRQLPLHDPTGRQLLISLGCAVMNARIQLAADGLAVVVRRSPDAAAGTDPAVLIMASTQPEAASSGLAALAEVIDASKPVAPSRVCGLPAELHGQLLAAGTAEDCIMITVDGEQQSTLLELNSQARRAIQADSAHRAELLAWMPADDALWADPTPALARFDHRTPPLGTLLICTREDAGVDWLRTGECLQRLLLLIRQHGFTAMPDTLLTGDVEQRQQLQPEGELYVQAVLFIGTAAASPTARRRRLSDVIIERG